jgi:hypothetical protein
MNIASCLSLAYDQLFGVAANDRKKSEIQVIYAHTLMECAAETWNKKPIKK